MEATSKEIQSVSDQLPEELRNTQRLPAAIDGFLSLPLTRQIALMVSTAISIALLMAVLLWSNDSSQTVLMGPSSAEDMNDAVVALQKMGVPYEIDGKTGALLVPNDKIYQVRMQLASEGLPQRNSNFGMEMLQQKPEFGTSQFHELKRYQLALEGELARSIMTIKSVKSARVHLALPKQSVFVRKEKQASASVLVDLHGGRGLSEDQVSAISHMVSSSIPDMAAEDVTIVDENGNLLSKRGKSGLDVSQEQLKYTQTVEQRYIDSINDILAPILGAARVRAQVSANLDFSTTEQTMETYNPDLPALRSSQNLEESRVNGDIQGVPGALSNQPPGAGNAPEQTDGVTGNEKSQQLSKRRESTSNYELDRTISHTRQSVGNIKRLTVAVVVDNRQVVDAEGKITFEPRTAEELERISRLVKESVGYTPQRGDSVDVVNISFDGKEEFTAPEVAVWEQPWFMPAVKIAAGALIALVFFFVVIRPMLKTLAENKELREAMLMQNEFGLNPDGTPIAGREGGAGAGGEGADDDVLSLDSDDELGMLVKMPGEGTYKENIRMVTKVIKEDPDLATQVIKSWID
ncbi:MAG: flagellar M-ring protein FliF, partial [Gammaproteobacteria bacterium]|nr:flagellar M-ring protein FliF [Gammaproteobacteria bacterium]